MGLEVQRMEELDCYVVSHTRLPQKALALRQQGCSLNTLHSEVASFC